MTSTDISIIICAYTEDRWQDLVAAVASVQNQTLAPYEIIVVIDHNPKLLARAEAKFANITVIPNRFAQGLSGARNSGIQASSGEILAFMDEDAVAAEDWLAQLATGYASATTIGVGGAIEPLWLGGHPAWFPAEFHWVVGCTYRGMPESAAPVRNLIGCNMSFRRTVFEEVGGFRDGIGRIGTRPVGCEETELCIRALQRMPKARFLYMPQARVQHRVPANRARWQYFQSRCYAEGLSKAKIASFIGDKDGLSNEWSYTLRTLPLGVLRGLGETVAQLQPMGLARASSIAAGLFITLTGYLRGKQLERKHAAAENGLVPSYESGMSAETFARPNKTAFG